MAIFFSKAKPTPIILVYFKSYYQYFPQVLTPAPTFILKFVYDFDIYRMQNFYKIALFSNWVRCWLNAVLHMNQTKWQYGSSQFTVSRQMPWAGNIAKTMTSNRKKFTVTHEMLTAIARHLSITWLFVFHRFDPFALLYNKSLKVTGPFGEQSLSVYYNIACRAAQSNSVYVGVLKIPIVHAR